MLFSLEKTISSSSAKLGWVFQGLLADWKPQVSCPLNLCDASVPSSFIWAFVLGKQSAFASATCISAEPCGAAGVARWAWGPMDEALSTTSSPKLQDSSGLV